MIAQGIYQQTTRHFLAPIVPLLDDPTVSEIMVIGRSQLTNTSQIYCERHGKLELTDARFADEAHVMAAVRNIAEYAGRRVDEVNHSMDARLPTGERVHVIIPPASRNGVCLTIRKFQRSYFNLEQLVASGSLTNVAADFLRVAVKLHKNIVVSGGTGTGKTTLLNSLSTAIPDQERIVVIEDSSELQLQQPHTVYLEAQSAGPNGLGQVTIRDLFVDSLRMRPDRIVVGEVRRGEALDLIQSMISGHAGSLTTVHANNPRDAASRLETLCLLSDADLPVYVARSQVASAIHLVLQIGRLADGSRRVLAISECLGLDEKDGYQWNELFHFAGSGADESGKIGGSLEQTGHRPTFHDEPRRMGLSSHIGTAQRLFG